MSNELSSVSETINCICKNNKKIRSIKNESMLMCAMMNDNDYNVQVYNNAGQVVNTYYPGQNFRNTISGIIKDITQLPDVELNHLMNNYKFTEKQAREIIDFSKEFLNTYVMKCNKSISLGGRENSNVVLTPRKMPAKEKIYNNFLSKNNSEKEKVIRNSEYMTIHVSKKPPKWILINN